MPNSSGWDVPLPDSVKPWHVGAAVLGVVGLYLLVRDKGAAGVSFSGPAEGYTPLDVSTEAGCDPTVKPGTDFFRRYVMANFGGYDAGILRDCSIGGNSGHKLGKSWDWGVDNAATPADVDGLMNFLFANDNEVIRRAGIMYLIYNGHIWNTSKRVWQTYTGDDPHTSHVHFTFGDAGANAQTSFYQQAST